MNQASFLMSGIPMSDGILPMVKQELGEVDGAPALLTDLKESDRTHHAKLRLYTAVQTLEHDFFPRVRFSMREVSWWDMTVVDGVGRKRLYITRTSEETGKYLKCPRT